jgi:hypothetical protein
MAQKKALRDRYLAAGINPSPADLAADFAAIEDQWSSVEALNKSGALADILTNNARSITASMTIGAADVMGDVLLLNAAGGQESVKNYYTVVDKYSTPGALKLLQETNPLLRQTIDNVDTARKISSEAYKRVMGVSPAYGGGLGMNSSLSTRTFSPEEQAAVEAVSDQVFYDTVKMPSMTDEEKMRRLGYAKEHGQKFKMLGAYFQRGARDAASDDEVKFVAQTFEEEYPALIDRIVMDMANKKGTNDEYEVMVENGKLVKKFVNKRNYQAKPGKQAVGYFSGAPIVTNEPMTSGDLKRLNAFHTGATNGWADVMGVRPVTFLGDTLTEINGMSDVQFEKQDQLESAVSAFQSNPSADTFEAIRAIDPEFAAEVERLRGAVSNSSKGNTDE